MTYIEQLRADLEAAADVLKVSPSTIGEKAGQGGQFYKRLVDGKRVWPETASKVRDTISDLLSAHAAKDRGCDVSHVTDAEAVQGSGAGKSAGAAS